ncbi:MAG: permease-like cell division protein FtsX [Armatimonadota bacterium]
MSFRGLEYAIAEAATAIKRNFLMSVASIMTAALTLSILGSAILMALGLHNGTTNFLEKFEIAVFINKGVSQSKLEKLGSSIENIQHVKTVTLIPADAAWKDMKEKLQGNIPLDGIVNNPLPDSFRIKLDDQSYTADVTKSLKSMEHIDEVVQGQTYVNQVVRLANIIKMIGIGVAILLFFVTAFIISNTIRLTVYARRREIKIMQLVGASNWFVRMPLLIEGTTLGTLGGGIACLIVFAGTYYVSDWIMKIMPLLGQLSSNLDPKMLYGGLVGFGWFIGAMGTLVSIQRFLKHNIH